MQFTYSHHWERKRKKRLDIRQYMFEFAIQNSKILKDKHWQNAYNAIAKTPPMGRTLKVVYRPERGKIKIITAFWID